MFSYYLCIPHRHTCHSTPDPFIPTLLSLTCPSHSRLSLHPTHLYPPHPPPSPLHSLFFHLYPCLLLPFPPLTHLVTPSFRPPALAPAPAPPLRCLTDMTRQRGRRCGLSVSSVTDARGRVSAAWGEGRPCVNMETPPPLPIPLTTTPSL